MPFTFEDAHAHLLDEHGKSLALVDEGLEYGNNGIALTDAQKEKLREYAEDFITALLGILSIFDAGRLAEKRAEDPPELKAEP